MGNKAILMSIKSPHSRNIFNMIKEYELRRYFNKKWADEQIKVFGGFMIYVYVTKEKPYLYIEFNEGGIEFFTENNVEGEEILNGKIIGRLWCDRVDTFEFYETDENGNYTSVAYKSDNKELGIFELEKKSCVDYDDILDYIGLNIGYAIHISKLEVFDKPREINEFYTKKLYTNVDDMFTDEKQLEDGSWIRPLKKAPQSWQFIEGK